MLVLRGEKVLSSEAVDAGRTVCIELGRDGESIESTRVHVVLL